eukprot:4539116-Amphidinium_carterae.1
MQAQTLHANSMLGAIPMNINRVERLFHWFEATFTNQLLWRSSPVTSRSSLGNYSFEPSCKCHKPLFVPVRLVNDETAPLAFLSTF